MEQSARLCAPREQRLGVLQPSLGGPVWGTCVRAVLTAAPRRRCTRRGAITVQPLHRALVPENGAQVPVPHTAPGPRGSRVTRWKGPEKDTGIEVVHCRQAGHLGGPPRGQPEDTLAPAPGLIPGGRVKSPPVSSHTATRRFTPKKASRAHSTWQLWVSPQRARAHSHDL